MVALERRIDALDLRHNTTGDNTRELFIEQRLLRDQVRDLRDQIHNLNVTIGLLREASAAQDPEPIDVEFSEVVTEETITFEWKGLVHKEDPYFTWLRKRNRFLQWASKFTRAK